VHGLTVEEYAAAKKLSPDFLRRECHLSEIRINGGPVVRIPYFDETEAEVATRFRLAIAGPAHLKWKKGTKPCPYGLWRLHAARDAGYVVLVEGESDAHTLWQHGLPALGLPGAGSWREEWAAHLADIRVVYVVIEPDSGGNTVRRWLARSPIRERARLVELGTAKDPSGLHVSNPEAFIETWMSAVEAARTWSEQESADAAAHAAKALASSGELAASPRILAEVSRVVRSMGVVGEHRAVMLLYLIITSRLLDRPVSAVLKGPSSAGKSFLVEQVLRLFPASAAYSLSAMSERALAYSDEPLMHRILVIYEAAGLRSDFASYLVRSLLSEGRIRYETVEKTNDGMRPRLIEREGPTGLLVTTTAVALHPENETRLLSIPVNDTAAQTRAVCAALAEEADGHAGRGQIDLQAWHALQEWLAIGHDLVVIPYSRVLAELIPPVAVRLRRDFRAVLDLVRTHALLHRATRRRDASGRVVATIVDYAVVRHLVSDLVADGVGATVASIVRETVTAVANLQEPNKGVSVGDLAEALGLDRSAASRRAQTALRRGYLVNLEVRRGRPAQLAIGAPLPVAQAVLPTPRQLREALGLCTCAAVIDGVPPPSPTTKSPIPGDSHRGEANAA
jgi:hypothetical protein